MPPLITFVARQHDGLPLVASFAQTPLNLDSAKQEARQILKQLNSRGRYVISLLRSHRMDFLESSQR